MCGNRDPMHTLGELFAGMGGAWDHSVIHVPSGGTARAGRAVY